MKCPYCNQTITDTDEAVIYYKKTYHRACGFVYINELIDAIESLAEDIVSLTQGNNAAANTAGRRILKRIHDYKNNPD